MNVVIMLLETNCLSLSLAQNRSAPSLRYRRAMVASLGVGQEEEEEGGVFVSAAGFGTFLTSPWAGDLLAPSPGPWDFTDVGHPYTRSILCSAEHYPRGREPGGRIVASIPAIWEALSCVPGKEEAPGPTRVSLGRDAGLLLLPLHPTLAPAPQP